MGNLLGDIGNTINQRVYNPIARALGQPGVSDPNAWTMHQTSLGNPNGAWAGYGNTPPANAGTTDRGFTIPDTGASNGGGGGGGYDPVAAANAAYISQQQAAIDNQIGRAGNQFNAGNQNVLNQYNQAYQKLVNDKALAQRNYDQSKQQSQSDNIKAKANIDQSVNQTNTGLQRLLGARGAGDSSAARILAPYAAGLQGNQQRQQVQDAYGRNMFNLDQNWGDTNTQFENSFGDLGTQKESNLRANRNKYDTLLGQLYQAKGQIDPNNRASWEARANDLYNQADSLLVNPTFTPKAVNVKPVDLAKYDYTQNQAPATTSVDGQPVDPNVLQAIGPYATLIGDDKKKLVGNTPVTATA